MDVIALSEAGFGATVAPLGTAVTEDQLRLMWQVHPEPVIALDGDAAGIRAALRLVDLALPLLESGFGLRFALIPGGMDPDDLIRSGGRAAMQQVLDAARPMIALIWQRETEGRSFDSPERRATLDKRLRQILAEVRDPMLRSHYEAEVRRLRATLYAALPGPVRPWRGPGRGPTMRAGGERARAGRGFAMQPDAALPLPATRASALAAPGAESATDGMRIAVVLATLALHPGLIGAFLGAIETLDIPLGDHARLRDALLDWRGEAQILDPEAACRAYGLEAGAVLRAILGSAHARITPALRQPGDSERARMCVAEDLARLAARRSAEIEIAEAMADVLHEAGEGLTWRITRAAAALRQAERPDPADTGDLGEDREALSAGLQRLIDTEVWKRRGR
jgi:DNA primase